MFLQLNHQKLFVYQETRTLSKHCYEFTRRLPAEERYNLVQQIRRAALSVHLNIAEGASRKSANERNRYYEIARGSVIEIDAALDACEDIGYCTKEELGELGASLVKVFVSLSKMING
ncbi:MAG: four helix bundle protein [Chitinophagaceae bacterium]|jgi:four helix bundle protein|nr:four helix bundle protein [Chitinophagaceae bacterium]